MNSNEKVKRLGNNLSKIIKDMGKMIPDVCPCCNRDGLVCYRESLTRMNVPLEKQEMMIDVLLEARNNLKYENSNFANVEELR